LSQNNYYCNYYVTNRMKDSELIFGLMVSLGKERYSIAELLYLIRPFGITETSLRTNLSRMVHKQQLESGRKGPNVTYSFSSRGKEISANVARSFRPHDWNGWDESWWGVLFSVPELEKEIRYRIRKKLTFYRFAPLFAGTWIRPLHTDEAMEIYLQSILESPRCRMIRFVSMDGITKADAARLWKLDLVNRAFRKGLDTVNRNLMSLGVLSPEEAFVRGMQISSEIVDILFKDPLLPDRFLPKTWKGEALRKAFNEWHRAASEQARPVWEKIF
jgi:phenylacetic acid degradation operon negative regulatory protein